MVAELEWLVANEWPQTNGTVEAYDGSGRQSELNRAERPADPCGTELNYVLTRRTACTSGWTDSRFDRSRKRRIYVACLRLRF